MEKALYKQLLYKYLLKDTAINFSEMDCYNLFLCAIEEKVDALLYKKICDNKQLDTIPKPIKKQLYLSYTYNIQKNKLYLSELQKIQQILKAKNIFVLPEKGIFLINNIYQDFGTRYMEDIDIIAMSSDFQSLKIILEDNKYELTLINDKDWAIHMKQSPIESCLFLKKENLPFPIPFIKIDISFINNVKNKDLFSYGSITDTLLRLCKYAYINANEKSERIPLNCSLNKLLDIICFIQQYPTNQTDIFENKKYQNLPEVIYIKECIKYYESI